MATQIDITDGRELESNPGYVLRDDAAKAWDRAVNAFGKKVLITGAWRSYATQERIFRERYAPGRFSPFNDYRFWPKDGRTWARVTGAAAAVPGTSNHGGGVAVDVKTQRQPGDPSYAEAVVFTSWNDADRARFLRVAAEHGWDDDEGRSVGELWHLTYYPDRDQHRGETVRPPRKGPLTVREKVERVQSAVHATKDGLWGDQTDKHLAALRAASFYGGTKFPFRVEFAQRVVGAHVDGEWGGASGDAHTATVRRLQAVLGLRVTGRYDATLREALADLKRQAT